MRPEGGKRIIMNSFVLTGRHKIWMFLLPQGAALGYFLLPLRGVILYYRLYLTLNSQIRVRKKTGYCLSMKKSIAPINMIVRCLFLKTSDSGCLSLLGKCGEVLLAEFETVCEVFVTDYLIF